MEKIGKCCAVRKVRWGIWRRAAEPAGRCAYPRRYPARLAWRHFRGAFTDARLACRPIQWYHINDD